MPSTSYDKHLIVRNTALLYCRMLITVWLNLWATRLTLQHLGVEDMGVYGVVGSVVSLFGVFTSGITSAVQRFITFELGRGNITKVGRVFSTSLNVLLLFSVVLALLIESIGMWVLTQRLNIPAESMTAARWVFHFAVLAFVFNIIAIPYNALVIAYERMSAFAAISILQVVLNCGAAWSLGYMADGRLVFYGAAMATIAVLVRVVYQCYCHRCFTQVRYTLSIDKGEIREIAGFAGVSTLDGILQMISSEGVILLLNLTFGVTINAVYAIALQLKNMVLSFALNVFKAIQPQITKTYAEGNLQAHCRLVCNGAKVEVFLIYFVLLPLLFRTGQVLQLWLGEVPAHGVAFVRGTIFLSLMYAAFEPIRTAVLATGSIVRFMLVPDALLLLVLPVGYGVARWTGNPDAVLVAIVLVDVILCMLRVWLGCRVSPLMVGDVMRNIVLPCLAVGVVDAAVCAWLAQALPVDLIGLLLLLVINSLALLAIIATMYWRKILIS